MLNVTSDFYNYVFNADINVPSVSSIVIDSDAIGRINPEIVTQDNIWNICVLMSLVSVGSGTTVLLKDDVLKAHYKAYRGSDILTTVQQLLLSTNNLSSVRSTLDRIYGGTETEKKFQEQWDEN